MNHSGGKSEVQVPPLPQAFPFASSGAPPHPHIAQFCRFSIPERLPLMPFRRDRLTRLPQPPAAAMATSKVVSTTGAGNSGGAAPLKSAQSSDRKVQQLEASLAFVREGHARMLEGLHQEIAELKQRNRELLFEIVAGISIQSRESSDTSVEETDSTSDEQKEKIESLENEVKKLRDALKTAMRSNASLSNELHELKREVPTEKESVRPLMRSAVGGEERSIPICGPSPQMEHYSDTLQRIQKAASHKSGKSGRKHYIPVEDQRDWQERYPNREFQHHQYNHRHHHQRNHPRSQDQQQRLPRLPPRNQQNYSHAQYGIRFGHQGSDSLPALVDNRNKKPRAPKLADQVTN